MTVKSVSFKTKQKSSSACLVACLGVALGCREAPRADTKPAPRAAASELSSPGSRYVSPLPSSAVAAAPISAPSSTTTASAAASVAPIPSLIEGQAACDACLVAERDGRYLTPQGVGHYLVGCADEARRQRCLSATRRSLPARVRALVASQQCSEARQLAEFADRHGASSATLRNALSVCTAP